MKCTGSPNTVWGSGSMVSHGALGPSAVEQKDTHSCKSLEEAALIIFTH